MQKISMRLTLPFQNVDSKMEAHSDFGVGLLILSKNKPLLSIQEENNEKQQFQDCNKRLF